MKNLSIAKKIYLAAAILLIVFSCSLIWLYSGYHKQIYKGRQQQLIAAVETAWGIIDHFSKSNLPQAEAQNAAKAAIEGLRFEGDIYFWINDTEPKMVMHPIKPSLNGQNLSASKDPDGKRLFVEMVDVTRAKGAGFVEYQWGGKPPSVLHASLDCASSIGDRACGWPGRVAGGSGNVARCDR